MGDETGDETHAITQEATLRTIPEIVRDLMVNVSTMNASGKEKKNMVTQLVEQMVRDRQVDEYVKGIIMQMLPSLIETIYEAGSQTIDLFHTKVSKLCC